MAEVPLMSGFPPEPGLRVPLPNGQDPQFSQRSFQHLWEIIPTHRIAAG